MDITAKASIDANILGGICPSCVGLTSNVLPEVQSPEDEANSQIGVSTRSVQNRRTQDSKNQSKESFHWYTIRCTYGRERKAYEFFLKHGIEAFYPTITSSKPNDDNNEPIKESRLPNILFVFGSFNQLKGYVYDNYHEETKYLRFYYNVFHDGSKEPLIVPMGQMTSLMRICEAEADDKHLEPFVVDKFKRGQLVRVIDGPFAGVEGIVHRYKGQQRIGIVIEGLLTITTAYISNEKLELVEASFDNPY